jgi:hypothetical protein
VADRSWFSLSVFDNQHSTINHEPVYKIIPSKKRHLIFLPSRGWSTQSFTTFFACGVLIIFAAMRTATINELKQELIEISPARLSEICLRLARFKKENKELLTYLLFEGHDLQGYIESVKKEISDQVIGIHPTNIYLAKKTIRKILRTANKHIRYTGSKQAEAELLIYFCEVMQQTGILFRKSPALSNLYDNQLKKARLAIETLHEDLQYDYLKTLEML